MDWNGRRSRNAGHIGNRPSSLSGRPSRHRRRKNTDRGTDWLQYAPLAAPWILKATGVPTRSGWGRMAVSQGIATMLMAGSVKTLKETVSSTRPDGSDTHSFPSGHTAWAFMGATMMARELADVSPWYAVGAYAVATGIAVERAVDRHHYPTDIVAGAGIGILSAQLGYWLGDIIFGDRNLDIRAEGLRLNTNVSYLSLQTGLALPLGPVKAGDTRLQRLPALSAALREDGPLATTGASPSNSASSPPRSSPTCTTTAHMSNHYHRSVRSLRPIINVR